MKPPISLLDLDPHWVEHEGKTMGIRFNCPEHHTAENWCIQAVPFTPALDGSAVASWQSNGAHWQRTGEAFVTLTLSPSIRSPCGYHGFIQAGLVTCCDDSR